MPMDIPTHIPDIDRATAERLIRRTVRCRRLRELGIGVSSLTFAFVVLMMVLG